MKRDVAGMVAALLLMVGSHSAAAITLSVLPAASDRIVGQPLILSVSIAGLDGPVALGAYDFSVNFDSALLSFQGAMFGDPGLGTQLDLAGFGSFPLATPGIGTVSLMETSLDTTDDLAALQAPSFVLAQLSFSALAAGVSPVTVTLNSLSDAFAVSLSADVSPALVTLAPVPEPVSAMLLLAGLGVLTAALLLRRRLR